MNLRSAVAFCDDSLTTIGCSYNSGLKLYTFKCSKALAAVVEIGQHVLVEGRDGVPQIVEVRRIDAVADIAVESDIEYRYAFAIVNYDELNRLRDAENNAVHQLQEMQRQNMRARMQEALANGTLTIEG